MAELYKRIRNRSYPFGNMVPDWLASVGANTYAGTDADGNPVAKNVTTDLFGTKIVVDKTNGLIKIYTNTKDGSTNAIEVYDSDNNLIEFINSQGFHAIRWRDEYPAGTYLVPSGASAPNMVPITIAGVTIQKWAFDGGTLTEVLFNTFEIPHDVPIAAINAGTTYFEVHIHGMNDRPTTSVSRQAYFEIYMLYKPPYNYPIALPKMYAKIDFGVPAQAYLATIVEFTTNGTLAGVPIPVPNGGFHIGGIIEFNLKRVPTNGIDNFVGDFIFDHVALHVPTDGNGSRQRLIK